MWQESAGSEMRAKLAESRAELAEQELATERAQAQLARHSLNRV